MKKSKEERYPFVIFTVKGELYCVNSKYISTLIQLPTYNRMENASPGIIGMFSHRNSIVELFSIRTAFGIPTSDQEYQVFSDMIDARKEDHVRWVQELERSSSAGEPFTLATDPHQCAFGKWYDHFQSENHAVTFQLGKIDEPHKRLHQAALEITKCSQNCDICQRQECLKSIMKRVKKQSMPMILSLMDETKDIFRSVVYREMVLVLSGDRQAGLVVDEVISVEPLTQADTGTAFRSVHTSSFISCVMQKENFTDLILEINVPELLRSMHLQ